MSGLFVSHLLRSQVRDQSGKGRRRHLRQSPCQVTETGNAPDFFATQEKMQYNYVYMFVIFCEKCDVLWKFGFLTS